MVLSRPVSTSSHVANCRYQALFRASTEPYFFFSQVRNFATVFLQKQNSGSAIYVGLAQLMTCGSLHRSHPANEGLRRPPPARRGYTPRSASGFIAAAFEETKSESGYFFSGHDGAESM